LLVFTVTVDEMSVVVRVKANADNWLFC